MGKEKKQLNKIEVSPNRDFYMQAILNRWSACRLARYAKDRFGEDISHDVFSRVRNRIPETEFLPKTYKQVALQEKDAVIDPYQELQDLVQFQSQRLEKAREAESKMPVPLEAVRREIEVLQGLLQDLIRLQQDMGVLPRLKEAPLVDITVGGGDKSLGEKLRELPRDRARHIISIIAEATKAVEANSHSVLSE